MGFPGQNCIYNGHGWLSVGSEVLVSLLLLGRNTLTENDTGEERVILSYNSRPQLITKGSRGRNRKAGLLLFHTALPLPKGLTARKLELQSWIMLSDGWSRLMLSSLLDSPG